MDESSYPGDQWAAVLDEMELRVALAERSLAGEDVRLRHFALPPDLGPLPAGQADRAEELLAPTRHVEDRLAEALVRLAARAAVASTARGTDRPPPAYVDRSA